jgi:hypothetical protein
MKTKFQTRTKGKHLHGRKSRRLDALPREQLFNLKLACQEEASTQLDGHHDGVDTRVDSQHNCSLLKATITLSAQLHTTQAGMSQGVHSIAFA